MFLCFRTKADNNGNYKYIGLNTDNKTYSRRPALWISKDIPTVRTSDIKTMERSLLSDNYKHIDNI